MRFKKKVYRDQFGGDSNLQTGNYKHPTRKIERQKLWEKIWQVVPGNLIFAQSGLENTNKGVQINETSGLNVPWAKENNQGPRPWPRYISQLDVFLDFRYHDNVSKISIKRGKSTGNTRFFSTKLSVQNKTYRCPKKIMYNLVFYTNPKYQSKYECKDRRIIFSHKLRRILPTKYKTSTE